MPEKRISEKEQPLDPRPQTRDPRPILQVRDLKKYFPIVKGFFNRTVGYVKAVDGVSFDLYAGECLGLVGESGSGKTTVGRAILRAYTPTSGSVLFRVPASSRDPRPETRDPHLVDLATCSSADLRGIRRHMQMIFQDPYSSLNPRMTVADIIGEPLLINGMHDHKAREARVRELLKQVGLQENALVRYPHAFSGGQRQRIGIARALALNPSLIIADEPVSALDVSVQAQVINLLQDLQAQLGLTYLFIAHDLSVVRHISDRVAVMYVGRLVELATVDALFARPRHPYTEALLSAVPVPDPTRHAQRIILPGEVADPSNPPPGCHFHPRCRYCQDICKVEVPELTEVAGEPGHTARCHFAETLTLEGASL